MGTQDKKLKPGEAREQGPSLRDELLRDPTPPPPPLLEESYEFLGDEDISFGNFNFGNGLHIIFSSISVELSVKQ